MSAIENFLSNWVSENILGGNAVDDENIDAAIYEIRLLNDAEAAGFSREDIEDYTGAPIPEYISAEMASATENVIEGQVEGDDS